MGLLTVALGGVLLAAFWSAAGPGSSLGAAPAAEGLLQVARSIQTTATPHSLPTAAPRVTATPTPRVIVIAEPTATPRPAVTAAPTATPLVIQIEEGTATPRSIAEPTPTPTPTPTPPPTPTATPLPTQAPIEDLAVAVQLDFTAEDWRGGYYRGDGQAYGRAWVAVYGAASDYPRAMLRFRLDAAPSGPATLSIAGLDDEWTALNPIVVEVNGTPVFDGASPFLNWDGVGNGANAAWTTAPFAIPAELLRAGRNEIAVANLSPAASFNSPPYFLLSDASLAYRARTGEAPAPPTPSTVPIVPSSSTAAFGAEDWRGGLFRGDSAFYGRPWTAVYGAASEYPRAAISFRLSAEPRAPAVLTVAGLDDELAALNPIAIEVNGERVFEGPSPFLNWDGVGNGADAAWTQVRVTIPADYLRAGRNEIAIANLSPSGNVNAPPYILLAEATVQAPGVDVTAGRAGTARGLTGGGGEGDDDGSGD